jgi:hypothetical protein
VNLRGFTFLGFRFEFFLESFRSFLFDSPLIFKFEPSMMILCENEKVLWIYLEIRVRRRTKPSWLFSELLVDDSLLLNWWSSSSPSLIWFSFFNLSSSSLWSHKFFELVLELQCLWFDDDDSMMNLWELRWIYFNFGLILILVKLGFRECSSCSWWFLELVRILILERRERMRKMCLLSWHFVIDSVYWCIDDMALYRLTCGPLSQWWADT